MSNADALFDELAKRAFAAEPDSELQLLLIIAASSHAALLSGNAQSMDYLQHLMRVSTALNRLAKHWNLPHA